MTGTTTTFQPGSKNNGDQVSASTSKHIAKKADIRLKGSSSRLKPETMTSKIFNTPPLSERESQFRTKYKELQGDISEEDALAIATMESIEEFKRTEKLKTGMYRTEGTNSVMRELLQAGKRHDQDMSGQGNNCGFHAIVSQLNPQEFGGDTLSPKNIQNLGHEKKSLLATNIRELRNIVGMTPGKMLEENSLWKVSEIYNRPIIVLGKETAVLSFPGLEGVFHLSLSNLERNVMQVIEGSNGQLFSGEMNAFAAFVMSLFPERTDLSQVTARELLICLMQNPETIGLLHRGLHFHALQVQVDRE